MFKSMFARLFTLFMAVLLLALSLLSFYSYVSIRDTYVNARMAELNKEARDIAHIVGVSNLFRASIFSADSVADNMIQWKATTVFEEFGAYIVIVDRRGRAMQNIGVIYQHDPDFAQALDMKEITNALNDALNGKEVLMQTVLPGASGPAFIVAVPWLQYDAVQGAVFIHTSAQVIEAAYSELFFQVAAIMTAATLACAMLAFWFVRRVTDPLKGMAGAAVRMAEGDFNVRAEASKIREVDKLAGAFNSMIDKLSALEHSRREFVANVSHELRSPITSIRGFIEGMRDGTIPPEAHDQYLGIVSDETKRLSKLITDLLSLSRLEQGSEVLQITVFDINELIRRVLIRRLTDIELKNLTMNVCFEDRPQYVSADQDRIEQVVVNLLDNAIKFTPEDGTITLLTEENGEMVIVTVSDTGAGISKEDREHIFERFYTADKAHTSGKGTGLGLSICKRILEHHNCRLTLVDEGDSRPGATFRFSLRRGVMPLDKA